MLRLNSLPNMRIERAILQCVGHRFHHFLLNLLHVVRV